MQEPQGKNIFCCKCYLTHGLSRIVSYHIHNYLSILTNSKHSKQFFNFIQRINRVKGKNCYFSLFLKNIDHIGKVDWLGKIKTQSLRFRLWNRFFQKCFFLYAYFLCTQKHNNYCCNSDGMCLNTQF